MSRPSKNAWVVASPSSRAAHNPMAAGMYATCAMPKNGTRWCSHIE